LRNIVHIASSISLIYPRASSGKLSSTQSMEIMPLISFIISRTVGWYSTLRCTSAFSSKAVDPLLDLDGRLCLESGI